MPNNTVAERKYIDVHSHLNFENYDLDRQEIIARLKEENISTITVGTTVADSRQAIELSEKHRNLFAAVGIHPTNDWSEKDFEELDKLAGREKVVAIGECGLDFFRAPDDEETRTRQSLAFARHIEIAIKRDKPLMIHCRNAYEESLDVIKSFMTDREFGGRLRGNMHFFAGDLTTAKKFLNIGFTLSFAGPITFARDYDEVIRYAPIDRIMSETDAPFATPVPYRGKRNEPSYVKEIVKTIASVRGEEFEEVRKSLVLNAQSFFHLL